jgi:hypothetical protein
LRAWPDRTVRADAAMLIHILILVISILLLGRSGKHVYDDFFGLQS